MITKESLTKETLGIAACCVMVAINLGIALVALIVALVDDGPPRSPSAAASPPVPATVDEASYAVPPGTTPLATRSSRAATAEVIP